MRVIEIPPGTRSVLSREPGADAVVKIIRSLCVVLPSSDIKVLLFDVKSKGSSSFLSSPPQTYSVRNPLASLIHRGKSTGAGKYVSSRAHNMTFTAEGLAMLSFTALITPGVLRNSRPKGENILHIHSNYQVIFFGLLKHMFKLRLVVLYHTHNHSVIMPTGSSKPSYRAILAEQIALRLADFVIVPTQAVAKNLVTRFGVKENFIGVIPGGVNMPSWPNEHSVQSPSILCVGRLERRKNQLAIIEAMGEASCRKLNARVFLAGPIEDATYFHQVTALAASSGVNLHYVGEVSENELGLLYQHSTIFVFPSLQETQGLALLEAMSYGLPVIASNIEPIREVVSAEPDCCLLVDPAAQFQLAEAIKSLLRDPAQMKRMSLQARKLAERYEWTKIATKYRYFLEGVINSNKK